MGIELYIYWRVGSVDIDAAARAVASFQHSLRLRHEGLQARLLRRVDDDPGDRATLMETYAMAGGMSLAMQTEITVGGAQAGAAWCQGPRHVEVFEPLLP